MIEYFIIGVLILVIYISPYIKSLWVLEKERPASIGRWEFINGREGLWNWIQWTSKRYYHTLRTILLIRIVSVHSEWLKTAFAVGLSVAAYFLSEDSSVVAAATVFYASLLFLEDRFSYAAILPSNKDTKRIREGDSMDSVHCEIEYVNKGNTTARNIETEMKIVDPVRNETIGIFDSDIINHESETPLQPKLSRTIDYSFDGPADSIRSKIQRYGFDDRLGGLPWAVITIRTPDGLSSTTIHEPLPDSQTESLDDLSKNIKKIGEFLRIMNKNT